MDASPFALKQCAGKCQQFFPATPEFFSRNKNRKDGLQTLCKTCISEYKKQHYQAHKAEISEKHRAYRESHKEQCAERAKRYVETHREQYLEYHKQYYETNKEQMLEDMKEYYQENREYKLAYQKQYAQDHREQVLARGRVRWQANREQRAEQRRQQYKDDKEHYRAEKRRDYAKHKEQRDAAYKLYRRSERGRIIRRALWHKREAQKKAYGGVYTAAQIQEQLKRQNYRCYYAACGFAKFQKVDGRYIYHIEHTIPLSRAEALPRNYISHIVLACSACNLSKGTKLPSEWFEGGRLL